MAMTTRLARSDEDIRRLTPVMRQLRPAYDERSLHQRMKEQMQDGYEVAVVEDGDAVMCVAGFVISSKLAWGRCMYVDDLVTDEHSRSRGAGAAMLAFLVDYAREQGCEQLHLDSGVQRFAAHRFYLRHGFEISSHHFSVTDLAQIR